PARCLAWLAPSRLDRAPARGASAGRLGSTQAPPPASPLWACLLTLACRMAKKINECVKDGIGCLRQQHVTAVGDGNRSGTWNEAGEFPSGLGRRHDVVSSGDDEGRAAHLARGLRSRLPGIADLQIGVEHTRTIARQER